MMQQSVDTIENIFQTISRQTATTCRDGPDGWTALEVLCHLRDYEGFYHQQAKMMLAEENPTMPVYDHEALTTKRAYNEQNIGQSLADLKASRQQAIDFYQGLTDEQWGRTGHRPFFGDWSMMDNLTFTGWHDANHIEQITRILTQVQGVYNNGQ